MSSSSKAIVVAADNFGEADRYVHFLTQKWGMITTLAKSARKSRRRYAGGLDLFCHDEIFIKGEPKERAYLQELTVLNSFQGLREDFDKMMAAGNVTAWIRRLLTGATPMPGVYSLLGQTLALIEQEPEPHRLPLLQLVFRLKLLSQLGLKPSAGSCSKCGEILSESVNQFVFDLSMGGILCDGCASHASFHDSARVNRNEKQFLEVADRLKLTSWHDIRFGENETHQLALLVTRFASYHTHLHLPR